MLFYLVYNISILLIFILIFPYFIYSAIFKGTGFWERLGFVKPIRPELIWIHAASVGEVVCASAIIREFKRNRPEQKILLTVMTKTGKARAKSISPPPDFVYYLPFDLPIFVLNFLSRLKLKALLLMESEMWANLIFFASKKTKHIILVNGRFSERTLKRVYPFRAFFKSFFNRFERFLLRTKTDLERAKLIGISEEKLEVIGELKFSIDYKPAEIDIVSKPEDLTILVCGCTHFPEEEILLEIFNDVKENFPKLRLVIAPRHPERFNAVKELLSKNKTDFSCYTESGANFEKPILLLDTMGKLTSLYSVADIAFVGGTLVNIGGHNPLEPAYFGVPVLAGPYIQNAKEQFELLSEHRACFVVKDKYELKQKLIELLSDEISRKEAGKNARQLVLDRMDISEKYFKRLEELIYRDEKLI